jgi:hypothetical protein
MAKPKWLEPLEQTGHFWMGFGAGILCLDLLYWRREAVKQWPPATDRLPLVEVEFEEQYVKAWRVLPGEPTGDDTYCSISRAEDTLSDLYWMMVGATCGRLLVWPSVGVLISWLSRSA